MRLGVSAALVDGALVAGDVSVADGVIEAVGLPTGSRTGVAAPGFVDLQVNGFAGVDLMTADHDGYTRVGAALLETGTTAFAPTFVTAPEATLDAALRAMPTSGVGPRILGAHLEGPFLAPGRLGVHDPRWVREPDVALLRRLLAAGPVTQVTLAPERPGALALIEELDRRGVLVSAGHSEASAAQARVAFDRGVRTVTHLFNAMPLGTAREPGLALAALAHPDVIVQVIVDFHHVAPDTVRVAWQAARGRFALVSDAVAAAGMGDGAFVVGGRTVHASGGVVRGPDGQLAGASSSLLNGVRNLVSLGVALPDALRAAGETPARVARRPDLGRLVPGAVADVVVLDDRLDVIRVLVDGRERVAGSH